MDKSDKLLNDVELEQISGGHESEEERKKRKEREEAALHGKIVKDVFGNVAFTDKTGVTGTFSAAEWAKLSGQWAYTGNAEYYMETINNNELKGVLSGLA